VDRQHGGAVEHAVRPEPDAEHRQIIARVVESPFAVSPERGPVTRMVRPETLTVRPSASRFLGTAGDASLAAMGVQIQLFSRK